MLPSDLCRWINKDVFRLRLRESVFMASRQTAHVLSGFDRQDTLGTPSDVPVPINMILEIVFDISDTVPVIYKGFFMVISRLLFF